MASKKEKAAFQRAVAEKAKELINLVNSASVDNRLSATDARHFMQKQKRAERLISEAVGVMKEANSL